ncbi:2-amino-4-hydroxy-6-hydroxymethyldihydropteridine diphosphokinase [Candidatus Sumerlaeota bacterium]
MTQQPITAYVGLGANLDRPQDNVRQAFELLSRADGVAGATLSPRYRAAPWGVTDQPPFINAACRLETTLSAVALLELCLDIERRLGRQRTGEKWGPRVIDLDLLLFGDKVIRTDTLELPHPRLAERAFVLRPLIDLDAGLVDPRTGKALRDALAELPRVPGDLELINDAEAAEE